MSLKNFLSPYLKEEFVKNYKEKSDSELVIVVDVIEREYTITLNHPKGLQGDYIYKYGKTEKKMNAKSLEAALKVIFKPFREERETFLLSYGDTPISPDEPTITEDGEVVLNIESSILGEEFISTDLNEITKSDFEKFQKAITADIDLCRKKNGNVVGLVVKQTHFLVRLAVDLSFLAHWNATALCLDMSRSLIVELEFPFEYLLGYVDPKITKNGIYQTRETNLSKDTIDDKIYTFNVIRWYLNNRLSIAMRKFWILKGDILRGVKVLEKDILYEKKKILVKQETKKVEEIIFKEVSPEVLLKQYSKQITEVKEMGFTTQQAFRALKMTEGKVDLAVNILLENPNQFVDLPDPEYFTENFQIKPSSKIKDDSVYGSFNQDITLYRCENFLKEGNIFQGILNYLKYKISTCSTTCIICDDVLGFDGMKPTVCDKDLCMHSLDQYSLGIDIIDELKNSETFDLLVSMTFLAASMCVATNGTRDVSPSPSRIQELNSSSAMNTANAILDVYAKIPSISQIITECNGDVKLMKKYLDKCHESAFPLIHWIISSNRAYIVPVPTDQKIGQLNGVCEQFILVSSNPEVEGNFRKMRSKFGSFYAFHGSASGNWHSILREGLKILSGTSKMSAGAAYGNGIYTAYEILYLCLETTL
jgi:hypothetical protein